MSDPERPTTAGVRVAEPGAAANLPIDEMVDGSGNPRPHWRRLLGVVFGLGSEELRNRRAQLDRAFDEDGVAALLPGDSGGGWRCDPIPLLLSAAEFAGIEAGLAQRVRLLEAVLADLYGKQRLLADGILPTSLVWPNPAFQRACQNLQRQQNGVPRLHLYAADLMRDTDGIWRVLADRTAEASGIAYALENRRLMSRMVPELFQPHSVSPLRPFMDGWQDMLRACLPVGAEGAGVALLTPGSGDPLWGEHVLLARELSCALVEGGDLTVRGGALYLKTLRGLRPIGVLLRRQDGATIDPLELSSNFHPGVPGLLDAMRADNVRVLNDPGSALAETPAFARFMPDLARHLLDEELVLPGVETLWLGEPAAQGRVLRELEHWLIRPALDGRAAPLDPGRLSGTARARLSAGIATDPANFAATRLMPASQAPCVGPEGLEPRPIMLRVFMISDGVTRRAMPGGLARVLSSEDVLGGRLPRRGLAKDVWVLTEQEAELVGPPMQAAPVLVIRRTAGDLPSRVADNFFWLGRYLERLESAARLYRATLSRIVRPSASPRELAELQLLAACLEDADLVKREALGGLGSSSMARALTASLRDGGTLAFLIGEIGRITELLRDRMTDEMHAAMTHHLRGLREAMRRIPPREERAAPEAAVALVSATLDMTAAMAGLIAENMVRGGGRLFLDLGRRMERAGKVAGELASVLDHPEAARQPGRVETGLRLVLELRDSVLTYHSRYLGLLQPAPALDLVLADDGNPRGFAFQLQDAAALLVGIAGHNPASAGLAASTMPFTTVVTALRESAEAMVHEVLCATDQAACAASLPPRLRALQDRVAEMSDAVSRHYFALLPITRSVGMEMDDAALHDAMAKDAPLDGALMRGAAA